MNIVSTLSCPPGRESKDCKKILREAGVEFVPIQKEDGDVRFYFQDEITPPYNGFKQIQQFVTNFLQRAS